MNELRYAVVILAAGYSSRMGRFKPLIKLNKETIAERLISLYRNLNVAVYLVVGWQKETLISNIICPEITIVENPIFAEGMFSSIKAGLQALKNYGYRGVFIQPVDVPLVSSLTLSSLVDSFENGPAEFIYPTFDSRRGHPPLVSSELIPGILSWRGEGGLKGYLSVCEGSAVDLPVQDPNILFDIDTPDALPELMERYRRLTS